MAPFVSITGHQMEPLICDVYWHCPINDSYNKCILVAAYFAIMLQSLLAYCRG